MNSHSATDLQPQFDAFGDVLDTRSSERAGWASRAALRLGTGVFWTFAAVIVGARVACFRPDIFGEAGRVALACLRPLAAACGVTV